MADFIEFRETFTDAEIFAALDRITDSIKQIQVEMDKTGKKVDEAFHPDFALGVSDALRELKKKYADLRDSANTLRTAMRNATDPDAIALYKHALQQAEGGMKTLERSAKSAGVSLKEVNKEVSTGKQVFNEFFGQFTKVSLIISAIKAVKDLTAYAVELAQQTQVANKQFAAFLGSAELAAGVVADLTSFSAKKFLDTGDVLNAGKALVAFGEDTRNLIPVLTRIADIAAATGKDFNELATIYGKARTAGVLYAEDINQLTDAGIPIIQEFAKQMGVSTDQVKKLASEGKISFEELQLAFFNLTKEGNKFAGQAETAAFTIGGAWRGLVAELRPLLEGVGEFFSAFAQKIINTGSDLAKDIKRLFGFQEEQVGAFFDVPVQKEKAALDEQRKLEEDAEKRRKELAQKASEDRRKEAEDRRKEAEKRRKEFKDLLDQIERQAKAIDIENTFNPVEKVLKQFDAATAEAKKLQKKLLSLATTPEQRDKVNKAIEALFAEINAKYAEEFSIAVDELEKLRGGQKNFNPLPPPDTIKDDILFRAKGIFLQVKDAVKKESNTALESVLESLADVFHLKGKDVISVEEAKQIFGGLKTAFSDVLSGISALNEAAISEQERLIAALDERLRKQQEVVDKEQEIAEKGLANNVASEKKRLDDLQKLRDEAEKKRLELQRKAARQQLLVDSAQQISSLATGAANVLKAESNKGLLGVLFAIGAIATLFAVFAKAKATAAKASEIPKFRKGTKLQGPPHEHGGLAISDSAGRTVGEAEGGEWLIGSQPSREHDTFLKRLNAGQYRGVDLVAVASKATYNTPLTGVVGRTQEMQRLRADAEQSQHFEALVKAYEKGASKIVRAIEEKPIPMPWKDGYRLERTKGNVTTIETVTPG